MQLSLDQAVPIRTPHELRYREWKAAHPMVYALFVRFAKEALHHGRSFSISLLTERVRWEVRITQGPTNQAATEEFKINNNYRAYLARDLMAEIPELAGAMQIRELRAGQMDERTFTEAGA